MAAKNITSIKTIENPDRSQETETMSLDNLETTEDIIDIHEENEFYMNILYQMCVAG